MRDIVAALVSISSLWPSLRRCLSIGDPLSSCAPLRLSRKTWPSLKIPYLSLHSNGIHTKNAKQTHKQMRNATTTHTRTHTNTLTGQQLTKSSGSILRFYSIHFQNLRCNSSSELMRWLRLEIKFTRFFRFANANYNLLSFFFDSLVLHQWRIKLCQAVHDANFVPKLCFLSLSCQMRWLVGGAAWLVFLFFIFKRKTSLGEYSR